MVVTLKEAMDHLNTDDDEIEKVKLALKHAQSISNLEIKGNDEGFEMSNPQAREQREDMIDRNTLQVLANNYTKADGATKTSFNNMASQDSIANYTRVPSFS